MRYFILPFIVFGLTGHPEGFSQSADSLLLPVHYNVIKINPTPMLVFSNLRNVTFSYERLVKKNQSVCFQLGYLDILIPESDTLSGLYSSNLVSDYGINFAFDYRFYPLKRNRYPAPGSFYIGPYLSYYGYKYKEEVFVNNPGSLSNGTITSYINMINLGGMVGYQLIFWNRLSIDMLIFGPSLTCLISKCTEEGNLTQKDWDLLNEDQEDLLREEYPFLNSVIDLRKTGSYTSFGFFLRYSVSIGIHF